MKEPFGSSKRSRKTWWISSHKIKKSCRRCAEGIGFIARKFRMIQIGGCIVKILMRGGILRVIVRLWERQFERIQYSFRTRGALVARVLPSIHMKWFSEDRFRSRRYHRCWKEMRCVDLGSMLGRRKDLNILRVSAYRLKMKKCQDKKPNFIMLNHSLWVASVDFGLLLMNNITLYIPFLLMIQTIT